MTSKKKVPLRKCASTGEMLPKKDMIRIVRTKDGEVSVDLTGKKSGRGTYVSKTESAVENAKRNRSVESQLGTSVPEEVYNDLLHAIRREALK
ncbi:YlxR family protein [Sporosarcina sp. Sa2YVA2]|uniref:YlxR family protein n=1 Tax=Sporosarcina quadrami TaxID=2762234 RepID=A0ABR8U754_9BACL|nr:YlxR family protein [Sporosarcina quadrami]MBD7983569.1 YlxR family protein [Sporosarcina quadrami]